jgi:hypothetical protein
MEDGVDPNAAVVMMFYKWRQLPVVQLMSSVSRSQPQSNSLQFRSVKGFPFRASFTFTAAAEGATKVELHVAHGLPDIVEEWIGVQACRMHVRRILAENCDVRHLSTLLNPDYFDVDCMKSEQFAGDDSQQSCV